MGCKLRVFELPDRTMYEFDCPACNVPHAFTIWKRPGPGKVNWNWNGNLERPTFHPDLICGDCQLYLQDGVLVFTGECGHVYAGRQVPLSPLEPSAAPAPVAVAVTEPDQRARRRATKAMSMRH